MPDTVVGRRGRNGSRPVRPSPSHRVGRPDDDDRTERHQHPSASNISTALFHDAALDSVGRWRLSPRVTSINEDSEATLARSHGSRGRGAQVRKGARGPLVLHDHLAGRLVDFTSFHIVRPVIASVVVTRSPPRVRGRRSGSCASAGGRGRNRSVRSRCRATAARDHVPAASVQTQDVADRPVAFEVGTRGSTVATRIPGHRSSIGMNPHEVDAPHA